MIKDGKNITIYDIAQEAGVSPATVSRILNGSARVAEDKRERVRRLVEKYDFAPNAQAKGLTGKDSMTLGLIMPDVRNPFYASVYVALEKTAMAHGYQVILCNILSDSDIEMRCLRFLAQKRIDVLILCGGLSDNTGQSHSEYMELLSRLSARMPVLINAGQAEHFPCSSFTIDDRPGMAALVDHLVSLGHRDIALAGGIQIKYPTAKKRELFRKLMAEHGLPVREEWMPDSLYSVEDGYELGMRLLRGKERPTAVIGINEFIAVGVMKAAAELGLSIPGELSVAGFDNTYLSDITTPSLTCAGCVYESFGEALMDLVLKVTADHRAVSCVALPSSLTVRGSTGRAPAFIK